jgi:hypothetical protein
MRVAGKRPNMHELESIATMLHLAVTRVHEMARTPLDPLHPRPPLYEDEWPEEVAKVLGLVTSKPDTVRH